MPTTPPSVDLAKRVQELLQERQQLAHALTQVEATLQRVGAALLPGATRVAPEVRKQPDRPSSVGAKAPARKAPSPSRVTTTADEGVLLYVKQNKNPTTRQIEQNWAKEGRRGTAANTLTKLVKEKKLKREPIEGERGSRYSAL